ncbi:MAG: MarR family transcriptional regulator [Deltaproteobacteria bacterium]|nr:MarR family transcriptional regulator [Deltaproteobacteria bacterium]
MGLTDLGEAVAGLVSVVSRGTAEMVASQNLAPMEFSIFRSFMAQDEWTITDIAIAIGVSPSRVSRVVSKLVALGMLRRRRLRSDRRVVRLTLTAQGRQLADEMRERTQTYDAQLYRGISDAERACFVSATAKIVANFAAIEENS